MGIPMDDNIHAPTVPSGPRSGGASFPDRSKLSMVELMNEKERIEAELSALSSVLTSHGVDMNTPLLTPDGFPRNDIDVAQIRITRARIIHLRNDHKEVMKYLEKGLHAHFEALRQAQSVPSVGDSASASTSQPPIPHESPTPTPQAGMVETPFARVNSVVSGSPADRAGLKAGDTIRSFGGVNWVNHERLTKIGEVVQQNEGRPIVVKVVRENESGQGTTELSLSLVPQRNWGGRGLLGCHLVPL
ncbi:hypothetical protein VTN77DRAFT_517 [Rasamsonia byssochlamydoides]|uniref:uncharacterized protein n=1 Tax=Rasamsonia byssochlamydoides TaxID=89139 RepID=UPI003744853A